MKTQTQNLAMCTESVLKSTCWLCLGFFHWQNNGTVSRAKSACKPGGQNTLFFTHFLQKQFNMTQSKLGNM